MPLEIESNGTLTRLILNRPAAKNKFSMALIDALEAAFTEPECRLAKCISIESQAADIFAAGADMRELLSLDRESAIRFAERGQALMQRVEDHSCPVLALVAGPCFGGAFDLAMSCHQIWAADNAVFCHPGARLGIMTGWGGTVRLPRRMLPAAARYLLLTADQLDAEQAMAFGLVSSRFPDWESMRAAAQEYAADL